MPQGTPYTPSTLCWTPTSIGKPPSMVTSTVGFPGKRGTVLIGIGNTGIGTTRYRYSGTARSHYPILSSTIPTLYIPYTPRVPSFHRGPILGRLTLVWKAIGGGPIPGR